MQNAVVVAKKLCKQYIMGDVKVNALRDVDLSVAEGEFIVVLGHSGSGKSTLLNILGGMDTADSGSLIYRDRQISSMNPKELAVYRRDTIGFVFQFFNLIPSLTARENVAVVGDITGKPVEVEKALELVGLAERAKHFPSQLSGGEQQRISIARAIVKNPDLLLCDEPTGALDTSTGVGVIRLLLDYNKQSGKPVVIITHNSSIAQVANRVVHMKDGSIERIEINEHPASVEEVEW